MISKYVNSFCKLKRAHNNGGAPHKPILLLSVLEGVSRLEITSNKIFITPELVMCFKELWSKIVHTPHQQNFALPFYHMRSESFWRLICKKGYEIALTTSNSIKSFSSLNDSLLCAEIDDELFNLMSNPINNSVLRLTLLKQYFPQSQDVKSEYSLFNNIEDQILNEDYTKYKSRIEKIQNNLTKEEFEEEMFVRGSLFKREIPKIYNYTCAISRMKITSTTNAQMVDACHIIPFSISKDDTIRNGISLSPNLHRAFDRGLISISNEYEVIISSQLKEDKSPFSLLQFEGAKIVLPRNTSYFPNKDNLSWHRNNRWLK